MLLKPPLGGLGEALNLTNMYISEILEYLIWPAFILIAWFTIKLALSAWEKKFPERE
jgi:hypothetical protein